MSRRKRSDRYTNSSDLGYPKDADGNHVCRWCKGPVKKPRLYWCSEACVDEYRLRADGQYLRNQVFKRDHGVCAACGIDTVDLESKYDGRRLARENPCPGYQSDRFQAYRKWSRDHEQHQRELMARWKREYASNGWPKSPTFDALWQADHILEVVNGGGKCGLENIQTLCIPCHKAKTKRLVAERARLRRLQKKPELQITCA
jgi:5-methylcytosine-specific restriction endonuclease McrA